MTRVTPMAFYKYDNDAECTGSTLGLLQSIMLMETNVLGLVEFV